MAEIAIGQATVDDVAAIASRRRCDPVAMAIALECAERETAWAARDDGDVVGVCLAHDSGEERYVGDLFVEASYRGQGVGGSLLDAALGNAGGVRSALFESGDPASLALVLRRGLVPRATVARFAGAIPREAGLLAMAAGDYRFDVEKLDHAARAYAVGDLDAATRGSARLDDHERFARDAQGFGFVLADEFVGYAYVRADGRVGPVAAASPAYVVQIFAYALVATQRTFGATWCSALVPACNARLSRAALRAGLRIEETLTLAGDVTPPPDLSCYAGFHRLLF
ncbi:MAG: GNAT family N-acetyltransferase [Candidatus Tumulicola sp.]